MTEEIIQKLNNLWEQAATELCEDDGRTYILQNDVAEEIEKICWKYLIKAGELAWNWKNVKKLEEYGYKCFAGERDSFGMLTACVKKDKKIFCFG